MTAICGIFSFRRTRPNPPSWQPVDSLPYPAVEQLSAYFAGTRTEFDLPLSPEGTTFQLEVWAALEDSL